MKLALLQQAFGIVQDFLFHYQLEESAMKTHEKFFLAAMACVLIGTLGQCLTLWIECDRETFGPKGPGASQVRDLFGQGVTPSLIAARLHQAVGLLTLLTFSLVLGVIGTVKVVCTATERTSSEELYEPDASDPEPTPRPKLIRRRAE